VNSVYRFFAWGSIPIGMILGGGMVTVLAHYMSRENALRAPFFASAALGLVLLAMATPRLTTAKIDAARVEI
jgi:MFS family permease